MLEIVVLDKYLIRGLDKCYGFSKVKEGKKAEVLYKPQEKKVNGVKQLVDTPDYSNFGDECFPSSFAACLDRILDEEVRTSNIRGSGKEAIHDLALLIKGNKIMIKEIVKIFKIE